MKTTLLLFFFAFTTGMCCAQNGFEAPQNTPPVPDTLANGELVYLQVEIPAEYPGGKAALKKFLSENLQYPPITHDEEINGKCYLRFLVHVSGEISDITVVKGVEKCPECDAEAVRVVKKMPKWIPGKVNEKAVNTYFIFPLAFKLT